MSDGGSHASAVRDWRLADAVALVIAVVCVYGMRRVDPDLYGYLTYGRLFLERGTLTGQDPFAYTSADSHWVTFEYVAQIALWSAYHWGGPPGLIVLKCLLGSVAIGALYAVIRFTAREPMVAVPVFALCTTVVARFFLFRPQLFTFACFGVFVLVLFRYLIRGRAPLWLLPLLMLGWANSHGGFVAGLGAIGLAVMLRVCDLVSHGSWSVRSVLTATRPLLLTLAACFVATLFNPQGLHLWGYVLTELTHDTNRRFIAEWRPASLEGDTWSALGLMIITAALPVLAWGASRSHASRSGPACVWWALSCVPLIAMSYLSVRHVPLAFLWAGPVLALLAAAAQVTRPGGTVVGWCWLGLGAAGLAGVAVTTAVVLQQPLPIIAAAGTVLGSTHPCGAVTFLRDNRLTGNVYNTLRWGAYITWELYPTIKVAMDGRNVSLFPRPMVEENLVFYNARAEALDLEVPLRYPTDFLLLPSDMPGRARVLEDRRWRPIFQDDDSILLVRADEAHQEIIEASARGDLTSPSGGCASHLQ